jgi:hypothetical protein
MVTRNRSVEEKMEDNREGWQNVQIGGRRMFRKRENKGLRWIWRWSCEER